MELILQDGANMIKFENTQVWGFEHALRGMRNPLNSHHKADSKLCTKLPDAACEKCRFYKFKDNNHTCTNTVFHTVNVNGKPTAGKYIIGEEDFDLAKRLAKAGRAHRKYLRQIFVSVDFVSPMYFLKEFDTYKIGTVSNSSSTMHKVIDLNREFCMEDFSYDQLTKDDDMYCSVAGKDILLILIDNLNEFREAYIQTRDKKYWYNIIQLLPSSYHYRRTVTLNYEVLANIYHDRKDHKLNEWHEFCKWIKSLPYSELITGED